MAIWVRCLSLVETATGLRAMIILYVVLTFFLCSEHESLCELGFLRLTYGPRDPAQVSAGKSSRKCEQAGANPPQHMQAQGVVN